MQSIACNPYLTFCISTVARSNMLWSLFLASRLFFPFFPGGVALRINCRDATRFSGRLLFTCAYPDPLSTGAYALSKEMQRGRGLPARPPQAQLGAVQSQSNYYYYPVSSHYAQAYMQHVPVASTSNSYWSQTTPEGYTLSSTYVPEPPRVTSVQRQMSSAWYQPGSTRCTKQGCPFVGSHKAVETHMMDRHLIYPPGWEKRKKRPEWDADPSLKG